MENSELAGLGTLAGMIYFFVQQCRQTLNISLRLSLTDEQVQNVAKNLLSLSFSLSLSLSLNVPVKIFKLADIFASDLGFQSISFLLFPR